MADKKKMEAQEGRDPRVRDEEKDEEKVSHGRERRKEDSASSGPVGWRSMDESKIPRDEDDEEDDGPFDFSAAYFAALERGEGEDVERREGGAEEEKMGGAEEEKTGVSEVKEAPLEDFFSVEESLVHDKWSVRRRALTALREEDVARYGPLLLENLEHDVWHVRMAALEALKKSPVTVLRHSDSIVSMLETKSEYHVRWVAAKALQASTDAVKKHSAALIRLLQEDDDDHVRTAVLGALSLAPEAMVPFLDLLVADADPAVRAAAVDALASSSPSSRRRRASSGLQEEEEENQEEEEEENHERAHNETIRCLLKDEESSVRCAALRALDALDSFEEEILELLEDPNAQVRRAALAALTKYPERFAPTIAAVSLSDDDATVRLAAVRALVTEETLESCLGDPAESVRIAAMTKLTASPESALRNGAAVVRGIEDDGWPVRELAMKALTPSIVDIHGAQVVEILNTNPIWDVRLTAADVLQSAPMAVAKYCDAVVHCLQHPDWQVRWFACGVLSTSAEAVRPHEAFIRTKLQDSDWRVREAADRALRALLYDNYISSLKETT